MSGRPTSAPSLALLSSAFTCYLHHTFICSPPPLMISIRWNQFALMDDLLFSLSLSHNDAALWYLMNTAKNRGSLVWLLLWFFMIASSVRYQQQLRGFSHMTGTIPNCLHLSGRPYRVSVVVLPLLVLPNFRISHFRPAGNIGVRQFHQIAKSTQNFSRNEAENVPNGPHLLKFPIFTSNLHESFMSSHHQAASVGACTWGVHAAAHEDPNRRTNSAGEQLLP